MNQFCLIRLDKDKQIAFDSTIQEYPGKWTKPVVTYCLIRGTVDIPNSHEVAVAVNAALETWGEEIPLKFRKVPLTQNPDITYEWVDGATDPVIKGDNSILGYSGFPDASGSKIHIKFNESLFWGFSGTNFAFNPLNTLIHESGHALGLVHSPGDNKSIMYNFYNGFIDLDQTDIDRIQAKYGKPTISAILYANLKAAIYRIKHSLK